MLSLPNSTIFAALNRRVETGCLLAALALSPACQSTPAELERSVYLMGTSLEMQLEASERAAALQGSELIVSALEQAEARLSTWTPDSELSRFQSGSLQEASPLLQAELDAAMHWQQRSDGAFEPRCGALVQAWDLRGTGRLPSQQERVQAAANHDFWEEGGFGKGAGLAAAQRALQESGSVSRSRVNLGGQWLFFGQGLFELEVAHPDQRSQSVAILRVPAGSVATSGNSERGIVVNGVRYGHVLNPRTGSPADDFGSVTVVHPDPLAADCLATAFLVLGPEAALAWAERDPQLEVLVIERRAHDLRLRASAGLDYSPKSTSHPSP